MHGEFTPLVCYPTFFDQLFWDFRVANQGGDEKCMANVL